MIGRAFVWCSADAVTALLDELEAAQSRTCTSCRHYATDDRVSFRGVVYVGPFCTLAGRDARDDTPNDDDGNPIVVRCETLGWMCGAWEPAAEATS